MKKVLIVDDEDLILSTLERIMGLLGYEVSKASDGEEAVAFAKESAFDLILLDIVMPRMNGIEAAKVIRSGGPSKDSPIIMISAFFDPDNIDEAKSAGANDIIAKPFDTDVIMIKSKKWVNAHVDKVWAELPSSQEKVLRESLTTLDKMFDSVKNYGFLPYESVTETSKKIVDLVEKEDIKETLVAIGNHDDDMFTHSFRMGVYLTLFARHFANLDRDDLVIVTAAGLIHDVGKVKIPLEVLNKPSALNPIEMGMMKTHVDHTMNALFNEKNIPAIVIEIGGSHHERVNGSGYPDGLKGSQIGQFSRMAGIVDAFDSMTSRHVYRPEPYDPKSALLIIESRPDHFDKELARSFKEIYMNSGWEPPVL